MKSVSIKRADLKGRTPMFTTASDVKRLVTNIDNKGGVKSEMTDNELLPVVKLLHAVYKQYQ